MCLIQIYKISLQKIVTFITQAELLWIATPLDLYTDFLELEMTL